MALDDFADIDEAALSGLDDLFDEPSTPAAAVRAQAPLVQPDPGAQQEPRASASVAAAPVSDAPDASANDDADFLDAAAIDEKLLSSVEDVLSELGDLEQSDEDLFGLHSELGIPQRRTSAADVQPDLGSAFPDIYPVESVAVPDVGRYGSLLPRRAGERDTRRTWLPTASILAANLVLLVFAWAASRTLRAGLQDVRDELDLVRATAQVPGGALVDAPGVAALETQTDTDGARDASAPPPSFDQIALEVAQREVERGLYTSARRRLYAVLALADRIEPERRDDVAARTGFLVADSYRREAQARREVSQ